MFLVHYIFIVCFGGVLDFNCIVPEFVLKSIVFFLEFVINIYNIIHYFGFSCLIPNFIYIYCIYIFISIHNCVLNQDFRLKHL